ncbi:hypothetical protein IH992_11190, partial [Candidatus Poribacteria bacterium]|nr:hypothetical protein [Candidatus Poribacteria bacterium]
MKRYILNQSPKGLGATGYGGLKPFVDDLKQRLHLHWIVKGFGQKLWGYVLLHKPLEYKFKSVLVAIGLLL